MRITKGQLRRIIKEAIEEDKLYPEVPHDDTIQAVREHMQEIIDGWDIPGFIADDTQDELIEDVVYQLNYVADKIRDVGYVDTIIAKAICGHPNMKDHPLCYVTGDMSHHRRQSRPPPAFRAGKMQRTGNVTTAHPIGGNVSTHEFQEKYRVAEISDQIEDELRELADRFTKSDPANVEKVARLIDSDWVQAIEILRSLG